MTFRILHVEDDDDVATGFGRLIRQHVPAAELVRTSSAYDGITMLAVGGAWDAVITDYDLKHGVGGATGTNVYAAAQEQGTPCRICSSGWAPDAYKDVWIVKTDFRAKIIPWLQDLVKEKV